MTKQNFYNLTFEELKNFLAEKVGIEKSKVKMRAQQLYKAIYQKGLTSFVDLTTVTKDLRKELDNVLSLDLPKIVKTEVADDKTIKWLLELNDTNKNLIEVVLIQVKLTILFVFRYKLGVLCQRTVRVFTVQQELNY